MKQDIPWSYGLTDEPSEQDPSFVCFDRFYCFKWESFTDSDYRHLDRVFRQLPGWVGYDTVHPDAGWGTAHWFGCDEEQVPFISAWIEQPYLQVHGTARPSDLDAWHATLLRLAVGLPKRLLTGWPGSTPAP